MPELPEVETVRKGLEKIASSFHVSNVEVLRDRTIASPGGTKDFVKNMKGQVLNTWQRRGKYLISQLKKDDCSESGWLGVHLRMTGYFQFHKTPRKPCAHTRVRFWGEDGSEIRFVDIRNFGQMWWVPPESNPKLTIKGLQKLGPEPFSERFNSLYLYDLFRNKTRSIKASLLDQSVVAGTGNIYADESLFNAGILPHKESKDLTKEELERLCKSLKKILKISIGKGGTTFSDFRDLEGLKGNYGEEASVYRRTNSPCRKCGALIKREKLCGRGTHWCRNCQS